MYRRRKSPFLNVVLLIIFGIIIGFVYYIYVEIQPEDVVIESDIRTHDNTPTLDPSSTVINSQNQQSETLRSTPMIYVPAAAVSAPIVRVFIQDGTWDIQSLGNNVGHLQGTPWIGETGNIVLTGHVELSDGGRGVFASLVNLEIGDIIMIENQGYKQRYQIRELSTVTPDDLSPLYPSPGNQLTLITCDNYDFFSDTYLERIIVIADPIS